MTKSVLIWLPVCLAFWFSGQRVVAGDSYAFLVGVKTYANGLRSLEYSENDVTVFADRLLAAGFKQENILLMTQTRAATSSRYLPTRKNVGEQFGMFLKLPKADDTIIVVFSGHGVQFKGDTQHYFCPEDADTENVNSLISIDQMYKALNNPAFCAAQNKLLIVDACRNDPVTGASRSAKNLDLGSVNAQRSEPPKGVAALFSCRATELSWEHSSIKHGVFMYHVIQAFEGRGDLDQDGELTLAELELFAGKGTQRFVTKEFNKSQTPERLGKVEGLMALAKVNVANHQETAMQDLTNATSMTETLVEDFRTVPETELPDGWEVLKWQHVGLKPIQVSLRGRAHITVPYGWRDNYYTVRLPPVAIRGNFILETSVLSNEPFDGKRTLIIELKSNNEEKLTFRCFEEAAGFVAVLPNSKESTPFTLTGRNPYLLKLERKDGIYRFYSNGKKLLEHDAKDFRDFDVFELSICQKMMIGSVRIGPLAVDSNKPTSRTTAIAAPSAK